MSIAHTIAQSRLDYFRREAESPIESAVSAAPEKTQELSFRDVLDAINPLNHIPIVSNILQQVTGHEVSAPSQIAGGTLFGGPVGFVSSIARVVVDQVTNVVPEAVTTAAALREPSGALIKAVPPGTAAIAATGPEDLAFPASLAPTLVAQVEASAAVTTPAPIRKTNAILELYGHSTSANAAYQKMQLLPYLREMNKGGMM